MNTMSGLSKIGPDFRKKKSISEIKIIKIILTKIVPIEKPIRKIGL